MVQKRRAIVSVILGGLLLAGAFLWLAGGGRSAGAAANVASAKALIAVQTAPGDQIVREIDFTAPISGLAALQLTGLPVVTVDSGFGIAVCSINGVGCPADNCFCDPNHFWSYEYWDGSAWQGYGVGASASSIGDGALEGWRWTEWAVGKLPDAPQLLAAQAGLNWLKTQQSPVDGGFGSSSTSVEGLLAVGSNGGMASDWSTAPAAPTLMSYFLGKSGEYTQYGASNAGKLAVGMAAAGVCLPHGTKSPADFYDPTTGIYEAGAGLQAWAMLGTAALSETLPISAVNYLKGLQQPDGGWEWMPGGFGQGTDTNSTALALQVLIAAGESPTSAAVINGLQYLRDTQNTDGGFPYDADSSWGTDSDTDSTAYVVQAIYAAGQDPTTWVIGAAHPISYLLNMQLSDGSFEFMPGFGADLRATEQSISALLGRSYPLARRILDPCPANFLPIISR